MWLVLLGGGAVEVVEVGDGAEGCCYCETEVIDLARDVWADWRMDRQTDRQTDIS